jgi:hypothetical protein
MRRSMASTFQYITCRPPPSGHRMVSEVNLVTVRARSDGYGIHRSTYRPLITNELASRNVFRTDWGWAGEACWQKIRDASSTPAKALARGAVPNIQLPVVVKKTRQHVIVRGLPAAYNPFSVGWPLHRVQVPIPLRLLCLHSDNLQGK